MDALTGTQTKWQQAQGRLARAAAFVQVNRLSIVLAIIAVYFIVFAIACYFKFSLFGQGFDQVDYEQAIWNTGQGHFLEESRFNFTSTIFGVDFMPILILFVPFYMLFPSADTLAVLQTFAISAGAFAVYLLAREKIENPFAWVVFPLVYLVYPTIQFVNMSPFQPRAFALAFLLFAFYCLEKKRFWPFLVLCLLAMGTRTDVSLLVAMFGLYALLTRKPWRFSAVPLVIGGVYFLVALFYIVPSFTSAAALAATGNGQWSGETGNSLLAYYGQFGHSGGEIVKNIILNPVHTLQVMFTLSKIKYLLILLLPLGFLPLLGPKALVLPVPSLMLNLLTDRSSQIDIKSHYQTLIVVGLVIAAVIGFSNLEKLVPRLRRRIAETNLVRVSSLAVLVLLVIGLGANLAMHNPVLSLVKFHESPQRVAAANELIAMIPKDAPVAATSFVAPRLLPRRYIYNFPSAPFSAPYSNAQYIMADERGAVVQDQGTIDELKQSKDWHLIAAKEGFILFEKAGP
jgi:uncharacterized membrane protein